jgi:hypothetical protein
LKADFGSFLNGNELKAVDYDSSQADFVLIPANNDIDDPGNEIITTGIASLLPDFNSFLP